MRFRDFQLEGYTVSKFGGEIVLNLVSDESDETSKIRFADVAAYHFVHTGGGIILEITKRPIAELIHRVGDQLAEWWRLHHGFQHWSDDRAKYIAILEQHGYHAWTIESAVGFEGFIIAKSIGEAQKT